ncbi:MAG TPA: LTA synthase family protein, partial [Chitinophagaceae bacterium]|nr:LTA synthase family protein [Chitinophagaceae bacterium]
YMDDAGISLNMVWESYPVIKILLGWAVVFAGLFFVFRFLFRFSGKKMPEKISRKNIIAVYTISFLFFALAIFGRVGQYPLRWSDAYNSGNDYKANLSLNPFQSFFSSLKFRNTGFDKEQTKKYFPLMAAHLGLPDTDTSTINFQRILTGKDSLSAQKPNIVLVICESFSAYKSSMWGNPLNTTQYFNELCKKGVFFNNCFSPAYGTAKGIWAIMTGIPDVSEIKTASRNMRMADQQTIMNQFDGYDKYYFIGGSASWANIRGLLTGNIDGLKLYEQQDYKSPSLNVWGISDKNLFLEANTVLKQQSNPFFAIIQTAYNHRPYTIPDEDKPFIKLRNYPKDTLEKYGFWSNGELNAYLYMDYTYKIFMEAAAKEKYFDNTIFVFVGDHGIRGNAGNMFPKVWTDQGLTCQHVPLLFYAPSMLQPEQISSKVSQVDIMPTLASLSYERVSYSGLGKNIFQKDTASTSLPHPNCAFIVDADLGNIGLVTEKYFYRYNKKTKEEGVYSLLDNNSLSKDKSTDSLLNQLHNLTLGYYESSRYLLFNNKKPHK